MQKITSYILIIFLVGVPSLMNEAVAQLDDLLKSEEKVRDNFIKQWTRFTGDKNVMGITQSPDGKDVTSPEKSRMDRDGAGLLSFQSDLTFHMGAFDVIEETDEPIDPEDPEGPKKTRTRYGWVSPHGALSEAGGSSALERLSWSHFEKYSKTEDEDNKKQAEKEQQSQAKEGTEFKAQFKVNTKEVKVKPKEGESGSPNENAQASNENDPEAEEETRVVARWEMRDEAIQEIEELGEDTFGTIEEVAKEQENEDDGTVMGNGLLYREGANRALQAMYVNSLRGVTQRRVNRAVSRGGLPSRIQMGEGIPNCDAWLEQAMAAISEEEDEDRKKSLEEDAQRMADQCREVIQVNPDVVMPRYEFVESEDGKEVNEELSELGVDEEDARERDLRVQMKMLAQFGTDPNEVQNNWEYGETDAKALVTLGYDENGNPTKQQLMTPNEQVELYNQELAAATEAYERLKERIPDLEFNAEQINKQYKIRSKEQKAWDITEVKPENIDSSTGFSLNPNSPDYQSYQDIVQ